MSGSHPTNTPVSSGTGYTSEISPGAMGIRLRSPAAHPFSLGTAPESLPDLGPPCAPVLLTSGAVTCRPLPGHLAHRLVDFLGHGLCFFSLFTLSRSVAEHSGGQATMTNQCHHIHTSRSSPRLPDSISPGETGQGRGCGGTGAKYQVFIRSLQSEHTRLGKPSVTGRTWRENPDTAELVGC